MELIVRALAFLFKRNGSAELTVPTGTMHSFDATSNKIAWTLKIAGDIPKWPDIDDDYDFYVLLELVSTATGEPPPSNRPDSAVPPSSLRIDTV